jgi:signal-transduction protein with cAMP-binding, CBS, and nucleotidyltransferase domain
MEPNHSRAENDEKIEAKPVREIVEPATAVPHELSVEAALVEMRAKGDEAAAVTDQGGKLLGSVSKNQMNRKVGGFGHDPHTAPVEPEVDKDVARCFEDQTIGEAEKVMLDAKVEEVSVVTHEKLLVGKATLGAIAQKKRAGEGKEQRAKS